MEVTGKNLHCRIICQKNTEHEYFLSFIYHFQTLSSSFVPTVFPIPFICSFLPFLVPRHHVKTAPPSMFLCYCISFHPSLSFAQPIATCHAIRSQHLPNLSPLVTLYALNICPTYRHLSRYTLSTFAQTIATCHAIRSQHLPNPSPLVTLSTFAQPIATCHAIRSQHLPNLSPLVTLYALNSAPSSASMTAIGYFMYLEYNV
jgi:hypothetical protein